MGRKSTLISLRVFIPQHMPNALVAKGYWLLSLPVVPKQYILRNEENNRKSLQEQQGFLFSKDTGFIEDQPSWTDIRFGTKSRMADVGCEVMATYNALLDLGAGNALTDRVQLMTELIRYFERHGSALRGKYGTAPQFIRKYFKQKGYRVTRTLSRDPNKINCLGEAADTVIVSFFNNRKDLMAGVHTISVTKKDEKYYLHNAYIPANKRVGYATLQEAFDNMSMSGAAPILVLGINR